MAFFFQKYSFSDTQWVELPKGVCVHALKAIPRDREKTQFLPVVKNTSCYFKY